MASRSGDPLLVFPEGVKLRSVSDLARMMAGVGFDYDQTRRWLVVIGVNIIAFNGREYFEETTLGSVLAYLGGLRSEYWTFGDKGVVGRKPVDVDVRKKLRWHEIDTEWLAQQMAMRKQLQVASLGSTSKSAYEKALDRWIQKFAEIGEHIQRVNRQWPSDHSEADGACHEEP